MTGSGARNDEVDYGENAQAKQADMNIGGWTAGVPYRGYFSPWQFPTLSGSPDGTYLTDRLTDETLELIRNRDQARPFYLNLWYYSVHTPLEAKPDIVAKYEEKAKRLGLDHRRAIVEGAYHPAEHKRHERIERRSVDHPRISDFEPAPRRGQGLDVRRRRARTAPRAMARTRCRRGAQQDRRYEPRFSAATSMPEGMDGTSILPVLLGETALLERGPVFWHYPHYGNQGGTPGTSVRDGRYKLIEFHEDRHVELPAVRERLERSLRDWRETVEARMPEPNPDYEPWAERQPSGRFTLDSDFGRLSIGDPRL